MMSLSRICRTFCVLIVICLLAGMISLPEAKADAVYNATAAVNYAIAHWNDGVGVCDQYVKACLAAGGINITVGYVSNVRKALLNYGTEYAVNFRNHYCYDKENPNIAVGDIIFYYCSKCGTYPHTAIITKKDGNGRFYLSQHNGAYLNLEFSDYFHDANSHSGSAISYYVVHIPSEPDTEKPVVTGAAITSANSIRYYLNCTATDDIGLSSFRIGTWNDIVGVDAAKWQSVNVSGTSASASFLVEISDFDNAQNTVYHTNVYAVDTSGNWSTAVRGADILMETEKPVVTEARIENITPSSYDVVVRATDNGTVHRLTIGTWHDNMSVDDAVWQTSESFASEARFRVNLSDFGNAKDVVYHTNVYAIDLCGNQSAAVRAGNPYLETTPPAITAHSTGNLTTRGYDVTVTASDNAGLSRIEIGTWHDDMSINDAHWQTVELNGETSCTHTFHIDTADLGDAHDVTYHTNAFAFDLCGNVSDAARLADHYVAGLPDLTQYDVLTLPAALREIEEEAFGGADAEIVIVPSGCVRIGSRAFAHCERLRYVVIPGGAVVDIAEDAFEGSSVTIIRN